MFSGSDKLIEVWCCKSYSVPNNSTTSWVEVTTITKILLYFMYIHFFFLRITKMTPTNSSKNVDNMPLIDKKTSWFKIICSVSLYKLMVSFYI